MTGVLTRYLTSRILPEHFAELTLADRYFAEMLLTREESYSIYRWLRYLQENEIPGWKGRRITRQLLSVLLAAKRGQPLQLYALFCPSYKKGLGELGFRTDAIGSTSVVGLRNLQKFASLTTELGFSQDTPLAIFFDLAYEQAEKLQAAGLLVDVEANIRNLRKHVPPGITFCRLSELDSNLSKSVGYAGVNLESNPMCDNTLNRIVERGKKFYQQFGWTEKQIQERSYTILCSEYLVGRFLSTKFPRGIMLYTPTMLERSIIYSGNNLDTPIAIIFPAKQQEGGRSYK